MASIGYNQVKEQYTDGGKLVWTEMLPQVDEGYTLEWIFFPFPEKSSIFECGLGLNVIDKYWSWSGLRHMTYDEVERVSGHLLRDWRLDIISVNIEQGKRIKIGRRNQQPTPTTD